VTRRSEDELRAAFAAKAAEAPRADEVLRAVRREVTKRPSRRRWLIPAAAIAVAAAVAVPLAVALSSEHGGSAQRGSAAAQSAARSAAGSAAGSSEKAPAPAGAAAGGLCRPGDVSVVVRQNASGATLSVTSRGSGCLLARVPQVLWPGSGYAAQPPSESAGRERGFLPAGATARATIRWPGGCPPPGDVARVDWGAGPVEVHTAVAAAACVQAGGQPPHVGAFTGLS
jgi:hypothetical protein